MSELVVSMHYYKTVYDVELEDMGKLKGIVRIGIEVWAESFNEAQNTAIHYLKGHYKVKHYEYVRGGKMAYRSP